LKVSNVQSLAAQLSLQDLKQLLRQKEREKGRVARLETKKKSLLEQVASIEEELKQLTGSSKSRRGRKKKKRRGRPAKKKVVKKRSGRGGGPTVRDTIHEYLSAASGASKAKDIVKHVHKNRPGAKLTSIYTAVNTLLRKDPAVKKIERGVYALARRGAAAAKKIGKKRGRKKGKKKAAAASNKPRQVDLAYAYLEKQGGSAPLVKIFKAVVGVDSGLAVNGLRMAFGRDKRFNRKDDVVSLV